MDAGWIGGMAGSVFGLIGGGVGTYFSIRNTNGPRERAFMVKMSAVCWFGLILFLGLLFLLPNPYNYLVWAPYAILLPLGIRSINRNQQKIRKEENKAPGLAAKTQ